MLIRHKSKEDFRKIRIWIILWIFLSVGIYTEVLGTDRRSTICSVILEDSLLPGEKKGDEFKKYRLDNLKKYKDIGINYVTVRFYWSMIERKPGEYDFSSIDDTLNAVRTAGLKTIVRVCLNQPPDWFWTYGMKTALTPQEAEICRQGGKLDLNKLSVYPVIKADGNITYNVPVDPWDATGNYLKCKFFAVACNYLKDKYADVVEYVNVGVLVEGIWALGNENITYTWAPTALDSYRRYLPEKYMSITEVNKVYKTNWKSFWEAVPPKTYEDTQYFHEWYKWMERGLVALYMREAAIVRRAGFKVSVLSHFLGTDSRPDPSSPNIGNTLCGFISPYRIELIDADLYVLGGAYNNITWKEKLPFDPATNPLVIVAYPGIESMKKNPDALYIMEDWSPNPALSEYLALDATIDGFQIMEGTFSHTYLPSKGKTPEEMFEKLKEAMNIFFKNK